MPSVGELYMHEMHKQCEHLASWLPNTNLKLGDVGVLEGDSFKQMTTLKDLGIPFEVRKGESPGDFSYTSETGASVAAKAAGEVGVGTTLPKAQAGVSIQFGKKGAFVFQANGCITDEIRDKVAVGQEAIKLMRRGKWDPDWAVVDTVVRAGSSTIVVALSDQAGVELTAKAPVTTTNLANASAGLKLKTQRGQVVQFIAKKGLTPLFNLSRVKRSLLAVIAGIGPVKFGGVTTDVMTDDAGSGSGGTTASIETLAKSLTEGDVMEPVPPSLKEHPEAAAERES